MDADSESWESIPTSQEGLFASGITRTPTKELAIKISRLKPQKEPQLLETFQLQEQMPLNSTLKLSTADALRQMRVRIQANKTDQNTRGILPKEEISVANGVLSNGDKNAPWVRSNEGVLDLFKSEESLVNPATERSNVKKQQSAKKSNGRFHQTDVLDTFHLQSITDSRRTKSMLQSSEEKDLCSSKKRLPEHQSGLKQNGTECGSKSSFCRRRKKMFLRKYSAANQLRISEKPENLQKASPERTTSGHGHKSFATSDTVDDDLKISPRFPENCTKQLSNLKSHSSFGEQAKTEEPSGAEGSFSKLSSDFAMKERPELKMDQGSLLQAMNLGDVKGTNSLPPIMDKRETSKKYSMGTVLSEFEIGAAHISQEEDSLSRDDIKTTKANMSCSISSLESWQSDSDGDTPFPEEVDGDSVIFFEEMNPDLLCQNYQEVSSGSSRTEELGIQLSGDGDSSTHLSKTFEKTGIKYGAECNESNNIFKDSCSCVPNLKCQDSVVSSGSGGGQSPPCSVKVIAADCQLSSGSNIPALTSHLRNVFDLILQTDFKTEDAANVLNTPEMNGAISPNKTENLTAFCDSVNGGNCEVSLHKEPVAKDLTSSKIEPFLALDEASAVPCDHSGADIGLAGSADWNPMSCVGTGSTVCCENIGSKISCQSQPHKGVYTKLLPKKSPLSPPQVKQVNSQACESGLSAMTSKLPLWSGNDADATVLPSIDKMPKANPRTGITSVSREEFSKTEFHGADNTSCFDHQMTASDLGTSDQDSKSSGAFDDDETAPRRSARIRTKTTGKTLKKQLSVDAMQIQPNYNTEKEFSETVMEGNNTSRYSSERILKDLSTEDLFKARIHLAADVVGDSPDTFELLEENLYLTSCKKSRARKEIWRMVCDCALEDEQDPGGPCGGNCLNRLLMIECSSTCLYGDKCMNKRFQHCEYAPFEVFKTTFKGWGIRAAADIGVGRLVMEYCGEVINQCEFTRRSLAYSRSNHIHFYFMALSQDEVIDATYKGNSSRFINHSCDPNAETQKWTVNGRLRIGFFTVKHIRKGEEITFDYQFQRYGKVAQKCHCGTAKCRGYLGKAPDEDHEHDEKTTQLFSNESHLKVCDSVAQEEERKTKKKTNLFRDNTIEDDLYKLSGGLGSSTEVLELSRLMVKCDTQAQRILCLQVLKNTTSHTRLKTFLQFHGLSIMWSWMVDISSVEDLDAVALKMEIINALCMLPITNKNVIEDSKVLSVVQRWAKAETKETLTSEGDAAKMQEKEMESVANCPVEEDSTKVWLGHKKPFVTIVSTSAATETTREAPVDPLLSKDAFVKASKEVVEAAASLLDSWKDLKEIYRIPKRQKPSCSPDHDTSSNSQDDFASSQPKQSRTEDAGNRSGKHNHGPNHQEWSRAAFDQNRDRKSEDPSDIRLLPGSNGKPYHLKGKLSAWSGGGTWGSRHRPWHCGPLLNGFRMSRREHRRKFEKDNEKREREKWQKRMRVDVSSSRMAKIENQQSMHRIQPSVDPKVIGTPVPVSSSASATFTPSRYSGNLIQINPTQPVELMIEPSRLHALQTVQRNPGSVRSSHEGNCDVAGNCDGSPKERNLKIGRPSSCIIAHPSPQGHVRTTSVARQLAQGDPAAFQQTNSSSNSKSLSRSATNRKMQSKGKDIAPRVLPPNWKTATDKEGRIYYYHSVSRKTQWDFPVCDGSLENVNDKKSTDLDTARDKTQPKIDYKSLKKKDDGITDEGRRAKDAFRMKISRFIVHCLGAYRKSDSRVGRISSTEDFKHIARKLTHHVMQKELKQVKVWEDLDFNANVKHKTKEFVKKYMSSVGPVYRIRDDT